MNARVTTFLGVLILSIGPATVVAGDADVQRDLDTRVQSIFKIKCSECHGLNVQRPKGGVSLHDLEKLAANSDIVVPSKPDESALWEVTRNDEMPPAYARAGPLNEPEKEAIRAWIASLPPAAPSQAVSDIDIRAPTPPLPPRVQQSILGWLGRFHILVIHFPIALLAAAALAEAIAAWRGTWKPQPTVRFCVLVGAAGAGAAVALGWLHADIGGHGSASGGILALHRWVGTTAGIWAIAMVLLSERDNRRGRRTVLFRILCWSGAMLVVATAHLGGLMVHGRSFFDW
jgi:mono/diheme cytochrome c family protein